MRISTKMMFDTGTQNQLKLQNDLYKLQNQMSTGRKNLKPSDDPVASAQALVVSERRSSNLQFIENQGAAEVQLADQELRLSSISDLLTSVKERFSQVNNGANSDSARKIIASEIRERFDQLLGLANSTDSMGDYVFSGTRSDILPFNVSGAPGDREVIYNGDDAFRQLQVSSRRIMDVSEPGADIFMRIPQGNGVFVVTADSGNLGTGVVSSSSVVSGFDGNVYSIRFTGSSTYELTATAPGSLPVSVNKSFTAGAAISVGGSTITITGVPAINDVFTVQSAANQDVFSTIDAFIKVLETPAEGSAVAQASMRNAFTNIGLSLDNAFNHVVNRLASVGSRRVEIESLSSYSNDLDLQYQSQLSGLQDLDYTEAISSMANRKMVLEAAQASFVKVSQMSLFSYL